jgi:hypothetical protein
VKECEERQDTLGNKLVHFEEGKGKNILIFGLEDTSDKCYFGTLRGRIQVFVRYNRS